MLKYIAASILLFLAPGSGNAQLLQRNNVVELPYKAGKWTFTSFAPNILKLTWQPNGYLRNEQISDAVIMKPSKLKSLMGRDSAGISFSFNNFRVQIRQDTLLLGDQLQCKLTGVMSSGDYNGFRFALAGTEKIYGAGERAIPFNRRGYRLELYNEPHGNYGMGEQVLGYSVPFITSSNHYALFFDNPSKGYLDIGKTNPAVLEYGAYSGELSFYVITGNDYPAILQSYYQLTGTQPLPPRWALGSFMSRFGYTSDAQVREIFGRMKAEKVPFDAVIYDLFWFGDSIKHGLGNLDWINKKAWPDPKKLIADFKKQGVNTVLITEPFIVDGTKNAENFKPCLAVDSLGRPFSIEQFYFGKGGLVDIFRKDAREKFWTYYKKQMDNGVEGWWGDLGEPEVHPKGIRHNLKDFGYQRLFKADEVHNIYGHYWTKMLFEQFAKNYPDKRLFSLNRSGYAGTQRYSVFPWSGDVRRSWSGLQAQLPIMLGTSMSGIPYIHSDAGGFTGGERDKELYVRWLQFSAFTPIFRPHAVALYEVDPGTVSFPSEIALIDTPYRNFAKDAAVQRYHRLPYGYTLSYNQTAKGEPIVSPLYYYFSNDSNAVNTEDEYMYGKNILVAPVLEKETKSRNVYLPNGDWYKWNDNKLLTGGTTKTETLSMTEIPVYVRAGSIIPVVPDHIVIENTSTWSTREIDWHYYASPDASEFTLYDDDGSSKSALATNKYELIKVKCKPVAGGCNFEFSSNGGGFPGKPAGRNFHLILHGMAGSLIAVSKDGQITTSRINENGDPAFDFVFGGKAELGIVKIKRGIE